jgi:hypothetical protein
MQQQKMEKEEVLMKGVDAGQYIDDVILALESRHFTECWDLK